MSNFVPDTSVFAFIHRLERLDAADRARLKRNAGNSLAEARQVAGLFYHLLPPDVTPWQEEAYFTLATLFPIAQGGSKGNLGDSLRSARNSKNAKGLDRRVEVLLDADAGQLRHRLRQVIHLLQSNRARVNWPVLLSDLLAWNRPDRAVQQRWARAYFKFNKPDEK